MGIGICLLVGTALLGQPPKDAKPVPAELRGVWRLDSAESEAGAVPLPESRPVERPTPMTLRIDENSIALSAEVQPFRHRIGPADSGHIDVNTRAAVFYRI